MRRLSFTCFFFGHDPQGWTGMFYAHASIGDVDWQPVGPCRRCGATLPLSHAAVAWETFWRGFFVIFFILFAAIARQLVIDPILLGLGRREKELPAEAPR